MAEKQKLKRLSQIVQNNKHYDRAIESYLDQLRKKRDWKNLEKKLADSKPTWTKEKLRKIFEWERKACFEHSRSLENAMEAIRHMAEEFTDSDFENLGEWIKNNSSSKEAWAKNMLSISDSLPVIKGKIMHLAYMSRSVTPINLGDMINGKE